MNYPTRNAIAHSASFPIQREQPPGLRNPFGLTFPPRAEFLVPKTHTLFLQPVPMSLVFAYGIESQDGAIIPRFARLVVGIFPVGDAPRWSDTTPRLTRIHPVTLP